MESGELLHPVSDELSIVDFANALHDVMGVPGITLNRNATWIKSLVGEPDHLVLVLADGFGMNFVETLETDSFMRSQLAAEMRTVFPSTTPIVLTSLATGQWPGKHSVIGWFLRLQQIDAISTIISYTRTADGKALSKLGVSAQDAYPLPSRIGRTSRDAIHIMPEQLVDSAYSNYWTGGHPQVGYKPDKPQQAIQLAARHLRSGAGPTCSYIYLPQVDSAAHKLGASHEVTLNAARDLDSLLGGLAESLPSNARIALTADHGHLDAPEDKRYATDGQADEIASLCDGALTGDPRAVYADVPPDRLPDFNDAVGRRFGEDFIVLTAEEVQELELLGVGEPTVETTNRMGNILLLSAGEAIYDFREILGDERFPMISHHGGLTPEEMRIPLVIA